MAGEHGEQSRVEARGKRETSQDMASIWPGCPEGIRRVSGGYPVGSALASPASPSVRSFQFDRIVGAVLSNINSATGKAFQIY